MKTLKKLFRNPILIAVCLFLLQAVSVQAQTIFNPANPAGKYIVTDYLNRKITLDIGKVTGTDILDCAKGRGTITANGRTLPGNWSVTEMNSRYFLCFETYDYVKITYSLPSGSVNCDQIIISQDGWASYNISELFKGMDCVKARKATKSKKSGTNKKSRK